MERGFSLGGGHLPPVRAMSGDGRELLSEPSQDAPTTPPSDRASSNFMQQLRDNFDAIGTFDIPSTGFRASRNLAGVYSRATGTFEQPAQFRDGSYEDYLPDDDKYESDLDAKLAAMLNPVTGPVPSEDEFMSLLDQLINNIRIAGSKDRLESYVQGSPDTLTGDLYPQQYVAIAQLRTMMTSVLGGALHADIMGSGKTRPACGVMHTMQTDAPQSLPILVIAPKTTAHQWESEMRMIVKGTEELKVLVLDKYVSPAEIRKYDAVIMTVERLREEYSKAEAYIRTFDLAKQATTVYLPSPPGLSILSDLHKKRGGFFLIVDEIHRVKNPTGLGLKALRLIPSVFTLTLSGTPMYNTWPDIWAALSLLRNHPWPTYDAFMSYFALEGQKTTTGAHGEGSAKPAQCPQKRAELIKVLKACVLLRHPEDLCHSRGLRIEVVEFSLSANEQLESDEFFEHWKKRGDRRSKKGFGALEMARAHSIHPAIAESAKQARGHIDPGAEVDGFDDMENYNVVLESVPLDVFQQQITDNGGALGSTRMASFKKVFGQIYQKNLVIVAAEHVRVLLLAKRVVSENFPDVEIFEFYGKDSLKMRKKTLDEFQDESKKPENKKKSHKVLFLSQDAGGTGTNINAANALIQLSVGWNLNRERQVWGRINRTPKPERPVVYRLRAINAAVDDYLWKTQIKKVEYTDEIMKEVEVSGVYPWEGRPLRSNSSY